MSRILIISSGSPCRNPRPLKEADALGRAGHDVTLLTPHESPEYDEMERALVAAASFRHEVVGCDHDGFDAFLRRTRVRIARKANAVGLQSIHALGETGPLLARARSLAADLTIVHNEVPHWIGCRLLDIGRKVAADFEDWHSEDLLPADRRGRPLRVMRENESRLMRDAAYVSTTSGALAAALQERYGGTMPVVISNSFPLQPDPRRGGPGQPPAFFWFSQTIGPGRGLEEFCAAWGRTTRPSRLVLLGSIRPGFDRRLLATLDPSFHARVEFLPLVPPSELPAVIARHDLGLALEQSFIPNRDLTITNKILQYFNAGLGVVASDTAGQREVFARVPGSGLVLDSASPAETAARLDALLADSSHLAAMGAAARRGAELHYSWERESPRLVACVAAALA